jgi:hypothetical protein
MTSIREELDHKLNNLSPEQLDSVRQFVESIEPQQPSGNTELSSPIVNKINNDLLVLLKENLPFLMILMSLYPMKF